MSILQCLLCNQIGQTSFSLSPLDNSLGSFKLYAVLFSKGMLVADRHINRLAKVVTSRGSFYFGASKLCPGNRIRVAPSELYIYLPMFLVIPGKEPPKTVEEPNPSSNTRKPNMAEVQIGMDLL